MILEIIFAPKMSLWKTVGVLVIKIRDPDLTKND